MRLATLTAALVLLSLPQLAAAQAGHSLSAPTGHEAAAISPSVTLPEPPTAAAHLSSEAQARWPSSRPTGVDPELLALRAQAASRAPQSARVESPDFADRDTSENDGPSFGASLGHAAAGFGIGTGAGGILGGAIGFGICGGDGFCSVVGLYSAGLGAIALAPGGAALGAWGFGELSGGTGNAFAALGGAYMGASLGAGLSVWFASEGEGAWAAAFAPALGVVLSMLGAAAGYQLSSHGGRADASDASQAMALPTLSPTEDGQGATVGAVGRF
ncbi:MAG: hypothetical protein AB8I08_01250 [Sandaracinaceae bacterium]